MHVTHPGLRRRLVQIASWGLNGAGTISAPEDEAQARALVGAAAGHRLLGPLATAVHLGEVSLGAAERELFEYHRAAQWWCLKIEGRLLELQGSFDAAGGVDHLVVKGPAIAHLDEIEPALRSFADLDLLVRAEHLDRAVEVLVRAGAERPWLERRPGFDHRFAKSVTLRGADAIELDLHRSICDGAHGFRVPLDRLFTERVDLRVGGVTLGALSPRHRLLHAAYHAVLGSPTPKLMSLRDLGGYLTRPDLAVEDIVAEARSWRGEAVLEVAVRETLDLLDIDAAPWRRWVDDVEIAARERAIVARQRGEGSSLGRAKLDGLAELSWTDRGAYLFALAVPSAAHVRSRDLDLASVYRRAAARAVRRVGRAGRADADR